MTPDERAKVKAELDLTDEEMSHFFPGRRKRRTAPVSLLARLEAETSLSVGDAIAGGAHGEN